MCLPAVKKADHCTQLSSYGVGRLSGCDVQKFSDLPAVNNPHTVADPLSQSCCIGWKSLLLVVQFDLTVLSVSAGSLTNLAKYPASTVQILGAEKALFRALKTKGNTPKYGLIFHSSFIGRAKQRNKGRISRYLANKCSIASRYSWPSSACLNVRVSEVRLPFLTVCNMECMIASIRPLVVGCSINTIHITALI